MRPRTPPEYLFHYACDHAAEGIGEQGVLRPALAVARTEELRALMTEVRPVTSGLVWLTDLSRGLRLALGFTDELDWALDPGGARCDHVAHRYRVDVPPVVLASIGSLHWWPHYAREHVGAAERVRLEARVGVRPSHWWVSVLPVAVTLDEVEP